MPIVLRGEFLLFTLELVRGSIHGSIAGKLQLENQLVARYGKRILQKCSACLTKRSSEREPAGSLRRQIKSHRRLAPVADLCVGWSSSYGKIRMEATLPHAHRTYWRRFRGRTKRLSQ